MNAPAYGRVQRRFESAAIDTSLSTGLMAGHPALIEGRTIFPATVVGTADSPRFLISGANNPKLGKTVLKGPRTGWPIFHVTLEERATCPRSCHAWSTCYGNAVPYSRRHRPDADLIPTLKAEVMTVARANPKGLLIRLHALGDFYSTDYVMMWAELLATIPQLALFGYSARREDADDAESRKIARVLKMLSAQAWERFSIRFSRDEAGPGRAIIVDQDPGLEDVIVCPAQLHKTEACASCGLCWQPNARDKTIAFLRHGMKRTTGPRTPKATSNPGTKSYVAPKDAVLADRIAEILPELFDLNPQGITAAVLMNTTGESYDRTIRAAQALSDTRRARWVYAGGQRAGKIMLPFGVPTPEPVKAPVAPAPAPAAEPEADLTPVQIAVLGAMARLVVDGVVAVPREAIVKLVNRSDVWTTILPGIQRRLAAKGRITLVTPGAARRPAVYRVEGKVAAAEPEPAPPPEPEPAPEAQTLPTRPEAIDPPAMGWSENRVAALREHVRDSKSASQSARILGVSRNMTIGKARRLGLKFSSDTVTEDRVRARQQREKRPLRAPTIKEPPRGPGSKTAKGDNALPKSTKAKGPAFQPSEGIGEAPFVATIYPNTAGTARHLIDLRPGMCKWPLDDPGPGAMDHTLFCAGACGEAVYCDKHARESRAVVAARSAKELARSLRRYT